MKASDIVLENDTFKDIEDENDNKVDESLENLIQVITTRRIQIVNEVFIALAFIVSVFIPLLYIFWLWRWYGFWKHKNKQYLFLVFKNNTGNITERVYPFERENKEAVKMKVNEIRNAITQSKNEENIKVEFIHKEVLKDS